MDTHEKPATFDEFAEAARIFSAEIGMDKLSRTRRSIFSFFVVCVCLFTSAGLAFFKIDTPTSSLVVNGFIGIAQLVVVAYLAAGSVDRSKILDRLGGHKDS